MRDACGASGGANAAHYAVKGLFCALSEIASLSVCDVLHNVKLLSTSLCAGIAAYAAVDLRIKLHHNSLCGRDIVYIVDLLYEGEERQGSDVHIFLNLGLTCETGLELGIALYSVDSCTSAAEAVSASAAYDKLISGIFHSLHDCKACRNCVLLAEQIDVYHFFHLETHSLINIR